MIKKKKGIFEKKKIYTLYELIMPMYYNIFKMFYIFPTEIAFNL